MSEQNPGQPGGYGGNLPGQGGPYGSAAGSPNGGSPPGAVPYPGGGVPGYPGAPQQPLPVSSGKKGQVWLAVGLGCGFLLLLAIGATVGVLFWLRNRGNAVIEDVQRQLASANAVPAVTALPPASPGTEAATGTELTADCKVAYACCRGIAAKSTGNAAAVQACEVFKMAGYPQASCASALTGYRQVAKAIGVICD